MSVCRVDGGLPVGKSGLAVARAAPDAATESTLHTVAAERGDHFHPGVWNQDVMVTSEGVVTVSLIF